MGWWKDTIEIVKEKDPAARTTLEVLLTYPGVKALAAHRLSHWMWKKGFKLLARMHSQFWRFWTNIEIHPGAEIASGVSSTMELVWLSEKPPLLNQVSCFTTG